MKGYYLIILVFASSLVLKSQNFETLKSEEFGISIYKPKSWHLWDNTKIKSNIGKFDFNDEERAKIFSNHKESILVFSFGRDKMGSIGNSIIPLVQVYIRSNPTKSFEAFNKVMSQSLEQLKQYFKEFEYIEQPSTITVDGKQAFTVYNKTLLVQNGREIVSKSRVFAIPKGRYFIQISFTDGFEKDDCQQLFNQIIESIKLGN